MTLELTPDGVQVDTYDQIFAELADGLRAIYGPDIDLAPDSPDGQRVGIVAKLVLDSHSFSAALYNQLDPDFATGRLLDTIIKFAGLRRGSPARSSVDVTVSVDYGLTLPDGYTVEDEKGDLWRLDGTRALTAGDNTVTLNAVNFGAIEGPAGTVNEPATVVLGVSSVSNPTAATVGRDEETDGELRTRRNRSLQNPSTSTVGGLFSAIGNLAGVIDLQIYENDSDTTDTDLSLGPHSLRCIVRGGEIADIAETIAKNKTGGTPLKGDVTGTYIEEVERPDGSTYSIIHEMKFDRPDETSLSVRVTVESTDGSTVDTELIAQSIAERTYNISEIARATNLYARVYGALNNVVATDMEISDDGGSTWVDGVIGPAPDAYFTIDEADVTVAVV